MVEAIIMEITLQQNYLKDKNLQSVYFGGGTPSLLNESELNAIFEAIHKLYSIADDVEITLEANPDDLNKEQLKILRNSPVNRLSIGVQSFHEADLIFMNRAHNAKEALYCIKAAQDAGFPNLTMDLIYGVPGLTNEGWQQNLDTFLALEVPHLSSYCLTVEEGTALHHFVEKGKAPPVDEQRAAQQFELLMDFAEIQQYTHYEISNFARPGHIAKHNTAYWKGVSYLGLGPSAHSYDGESRQWNIANNTKYMKAVKSGALPFEREQLDAKDRYNEYVLTRLRTYWGIKQEDLVRVVPEHANAFSEKIKAFEKRELVQQIEKAWVLTRAGKTIGGLYFNGT